VNAWLARLLGVARRRHGDLALQDEIDTHLALQAEEFERRGMSPADARDAARRAFGGVDKTKADYRYQRGLPILDTLSQDVRFASRVLIRDSSFAITAVVVLAIGIGVNNMMFTMIYGSTLRGLPIERPDRVLFVSTFDQRFPDRALSYPEFDDISRGARTLTGLAAFVNAPVAVSDEHRTPERVDGTYLTANAFELAGTAAMMGRGLAAADDRAGAAPVVVLGSSVWRTRYRSDPSILGTTILINGAPATVIGVMPAPSGFPSTAEIWLPLASMPGLATDKRDARTLRVFGRVRDDATVSDARTEIQSIVARAALEHPDTSQGLQGRVVAINERFFGSATQATWLAFVTASILIVIVSCANAANLLLARSVLRAREIAIRCSLGASRRRIVGQLLIESVVLAVLGGSLGLLISLAGASVFRSAIPDNSMPYWFNYTMDAKVFGALVSVSFLAVLVFGLVPALQASKADVNRVLKDGGRSAMSRRHTARLTFAFLAAEIALTVVLLAQAVVSAQVDGNDLASDAVIDASELLTAAVALPPTEYTTPRQRAAYYAQVVERLAAIPGVASAAVTSALPLSGSMPQSLEIEGRPRAAGEQALTAATVTIGPRYFDTLAIPLVRGRDFTPDDGLTGRESVIVSQRFAETHFSGADAIGRRLRLTPANAPAGAGAWHTIVGVSSNLRQQAAAGNHAVVYLPVAGVAPAAASFILRSSMDPAALTQSVRAAAASVDVNLPLYRVMTMRQVIRDAQWAGRVSHGLITTLTVIALALSIAGLYAVTMYAVGQRTQEIGIRVALGARPVEIRLLVLRAAALPTAIGLALGLAGTIVWEATFFSGPLDLKVFSPNVLIPVALLVTAATALACLAPVRRATRLDPVAALREE
jgi:putative ABC transport system permease protein